MAKAVKMSDIADRLSISTVTVSKALSDQKGVSEEMRKKIKQLAKEMGYQKPESKEKDNIRSFNIGVIAAYGYMGKYETFYWELYRKINTEAVRRNCFVMLEVISEDDENASVPPKILKEHKVDGLIVLGGLRTKYLQMIREHYSIPTVYMDFYDPAIKEDCIISNSFYGSYLLTNYLFDKGHKDIGFVGTVLSTKSITDRYMGYFKSLAEHGIAPREDWVIDDRDDRRENFHTFRLPEEMPTAFVCNCDMIASWFVRELQKVGIRVPEDVSVVGFDDFLYPGLCDVPMTTYAVDMGKMAKSGMRVLLTKMNGESTSGGMHFVEGYFVERNSVTRIKE